MPTNTVNVIKYGDKVASKGGTKANGAISVAKPKTPAEKPAVIVKNIVAEDHELAMVLKKSFKTKVR